MTDEIAVANSSGFQKGDVLVIDGTPGTYIIKDMTSTTLTIKRPPWWQRLWGCAQRGFWWLRRMFWKLWPF
ncbi:unnamed protein product [marine sediment metagenome]|uniref:Uncharacterized protein n=1 Tax=marine sediment metagenome TaxID=412755 RepID=X0VYJ2_9ZZZZ